MNINPSTLYLIAGVLIILIVIGIIKKAIKLTVVICILLAINLYLVPIAKDLKDKYKVTLENGVIVMSVEGKEIKLDPKECKEIKIIPNDEGSYTLRAVMKDGEKDVKIPKFVVKYVENKAKEINIKVSKE
ncbi:MAG: hypothetical protein ACRDA4_07230 [Filifactoraceae bacterium]